MRAAVFALAALALPGAALAADYAVVVRETPVAASPDKVWKAVGDYCAIEAWMKLKCAYSSGSGDVGTVRRLNDRFEEVMVARTAHSYTYAQPGSPIAYHGTLAVEPDGKKGSKIVYTVFYDQEPLATPEAQAADRERRGKMFEGAIANMKAIAEAK